MRLIDDRVTKRELAFALEWGVDLLPELVSFAEREPGQAKAVFAKLAAIRMASRSVHSGLDGTPDQRYLAEGLSKSLRQRSIEQAYDAITSKDASKMAVLDAQAIVAQRVVAMLHKPADLEIAGATKDMATYRSPSLSTTMTLKDGRISFTIRLSDAECDSLRKIGLDISGLLTGNDRRIGLRIDQEPGFPLSVDIGNHNGIKDAPLLGRVVGDAIADANDKVSELRGRNYRASQRLRNRRSDRHHVTEHLAHPTLPKRFNEVIAGLRRRFDREVTDVLESRHVVTFMPRQAGRHPIARQKVPA
jgi:hypothetical protein